MRAGCVLPTKNTLVLEQPEYEYYAIGPFAVDAIDNISGGDDAALAVIDSDTEDVIDGIAISKSYILAATKMISGWSAICCSKAKLGSMMTSSKTFLSSSARSVHSAYGSARV